MHRFWQMIRHEVREAVPPTIFFLILFHLAAFTKALLLESYGITVVTASVATVGALIVAKAILIADKLPWTGRFAGNPLLVGAVWRTMLYALFCLAFRLIEELVPLIVKHGGVMLAFENYIDEVSWPHFWTLQIWLLIALALYAAVVELDMHLGAGSIRRAFLARRRDATR